MRFAPLLVALPLLLALMDSACADCGPGSPPDCTCVIGTQFTSEQVVLIQPTQWLEPLPVTPAEFTSGELVLHGVNNYAGVSTITSSLYIPSYPVSTFGPTSFSHMSIIAADPIPMITTLAPATNLPLFSPTIFQSNYTVQSNYTSSGASSSGVLSFSMYNFPSSEIASSGSTFTTMVSSLPIFQVGSGSSAFSELPIPEPTTLALVSLELIFLSAFRQRRRRGIR